MPSTSRRNGKASLPSRSSREKIHESLDRRPTKHTYALRQWTIERRSSGWFVCPTTSSIVGNKPEWKGPFVDIENAVLSIARGLAVEVADRHTRAIEFHKINPDDPLHGLKPTTRLDQRGESVS